MKIIKILQRQPKTPACSPHTQSPEHTTSLIYLNTVFERETMKHLPYCDNCLLFAVLLHSPLLQWKTVHQIYLLQVVNDARSQWCPLLCA